MERIILHSDMNSCYASIEHLYHPELQGKPLAVGGLTEKRHGIILAKDELAKKAGVKTGMALWQAKKLCPEISIIQPRMELYKEFSAMAHKIYCRYTNQVERFGLDECWLDVSGGNASGPSDGKKIAEDIRQRIKSELGITVSVGVSWNKIFAKLGSDYKKPDAVTVISKKNFKNLIWPAPVDSLLYVGRSTGRKLHNIGVHTIGQLAAMSPDRLEALFGKKGIDLYNFANGYDASPVAFSDYRREIKSIGNSTTTHRDLINERDVFLVLLSLCEIVGTRLRKNRFKCTVVEISVRSNKLNWLTRQRKLLHPTDITQELLDCSVSLFKENYSWDSPIRSLGVRTSGLIPAEDYEQLSLFTDLSRRDKLRSIDAAVDSIRRSFGFCSIQRGAAFTDPQLSHIDIHSDLSPLPKNDN